jgi:hypothetical protein
MARTYTAYICTGLVIFLSSATSFGQVAAFDPATIDFGHIVNPGAKLEIVANLRNIGQGDIEVSKVSAGCGCIVPTILGDRKIQPGQSCKIQFVLHPDAAMLGEHNYEVVAISSDQTGLLATAQAKYDYSPEIEYFPKKATVLGKADNAFSQSGVGSVAVHLIDHGTKPTRVVSVELSNPFLERSILDINYVNTRDEVTHAIDVNVIFPAGWPIGPVDEMVTIHTDNPRFEKISIPIGGEVEGPVKVFPPIVFLNGVETGAKFTRTVTLKSDRPIICDVIRPLNPSMAISKSEAEDGRTLILTVSGVAAQRGADPGEYQDAFYIPILSPGKYSQKVVVCGYLLDDSSPSTPSPNRSRPASAP